jgi:hypothetical protein
MSSTTKLAFLAEKASSLSSTIALLETSAQCAWGVCGLKKKVARFAKTKHVPSDPFVITCGHVLPHERNFQLFIITYYVSRFTTRLPTTTTTHDHCVSQDRFSAECTPTNEM